MKVLLVNGSSHAHGTTARALDEMIGVFQAAGVETEVIQLGGSPIADCLQCGKYAGVNKPECYCESSTNCDNHCGI